jgi:hypothetical protein
MVDAVSGVWFGAGSPAGRPEISLALGRVKPAADGGGKKTEGFFFFVKKKQKTFTH